MITSSLHFEISERKILLRIMDLVSIFSLLIFIGYYFDFSYFSINLTHWHWIVVLAVYFLVFGTIFELYDLQKASRFYTSLKNILFCVAITVLFYLLTPYLTPVLPDNRLQIVCFFCTMSFALITWRYLYINLFATPRFNKRILVVGNSRDIERIVKNLHIADPNYRVVCYVNTEENAGKLNLPAAKAVETKNLSKAVRRYSVSEVVVSSTVSDIDYLIYNQLIVLLEKGFPVREYIQVYEEITHKVPVGHFDKDFYKYFPFSRSNKNRFYLFFTQVFSFIFAVIGIIFTALLIPFIIIGNLIANPGPLFYTQERIGHNSKIFKILKFRTMIRNAETNGAQWSQKGDRRITKFGKILRNTRLDELPQYYNILRGEMSFIGPRPERPEFVKTLSQDIPYYETRHVVKPGLTGWAQVRGRYASSKEDAMEKLQYDLYYIKHRTIFLDLDILLKTCSTVIYYRGQ